MSTPSPGTIVWRDLTVDDADSLRDFYTAVVGWKADPCAVDDYSDYNLTPAGDDEAVAGICHRRGINENVPAQWLVYVTVASLDASLEEVTSHGGAVIDGPRSMGKNRFAVIRDPAGAVIGLIE